MMKYGKVNVPAEEFESRNVKVRIITMVSEDVLIALKAEAEETEVGHQTLLNEKLRKYQ